MWIFLIQYGYSDLLTLVDVSFWPFGLYNRLQQPLSCDVAIYVYIQTARFVEDFALEFKRG